MECYRDEAPRCAAALRLAAEPAGRIEMTWVAKGLPQSADLQAAVPIARSALRLAQRTILPARKHKDLADMSVACA